ncbi:MAG: transglycosylase SLT domain-containing protein [Candidatus Nanopelagicus sp.]
MRAREFITEAFNPNEYAREQAEKYGIPFSMVQHAMQKETGHITDPARRAAALGPKTKSGERAGGYMQIMPSTAKDLGVKNVFDPKQNIAGGVKYLAQMYNKFQDPKMALAAYNYGPRNVEKWIEKGGDPKNLPKETRRYVYGDPKKKIAGYIPDEETPQIAAAQSAAPIGLPPKAAKAATNVLATVTGSRDAIARDEVQQRRVRPGDSQKFPVTKTAGKRSTIAAPVQEPVEPPVVTKMATQKFPLTKAPEPVESPVVTKMATQQFPLTKAPKPTATQQFPSTIVPEPSATQNVPKTATIDRTIQRGETLTSIAKEAGVGVNDILALNPHITNPDLIYAGSTIRAPTDF